MKIRYLHTMVRVKDLDATMRFFGLLGLRRRAATRSRPGASPSSSWPPRGRRNAPSS